MVSIHSAWQVDVQGSKLLLLVTRVESLFSKTSLFHYMHIPLEFAFVQMSFPKVSFSPCVLPFSLAALKQL